MRLFGFGQVIDSDRPIAGAIAAPDDAAPGIVVRHHPHHVRGTAELYAWDGRELLFASLRGATYRCRADAIDVVPYPGADPDDVAGLLIATALPAALWSQGRFVLHAAAVRLPGCDRALAICGPSGVGKSTLAAALLARGASLVADDSVALDAEARACGLPGGLFEVVPGADRRFVAAADVCTTAVPLAAVIVLSRREGAPSRLAPLAAFEALLVNRHRPLVPDTLGRRQEVLTMCARLSSALPIHAWPRREGRGLGEDEWRMLTALSQWKGNA